MGVEREIERYLQISRRVEIERIRWADFADPPLTGDERFALEYMMDIEAHTPFYMQDMMTPRAMRDADLVAFLTLWSYEEMYHGEALRRVLEANGVRVEVDRTVRVRRAAGIQETIERAGTWLAAHLTRHFVAAHMAWGAINELTAHAAYSAIAHHTANPHLGRLLSQIAKDERRHYSFYSTQARRRLEHEPFGRLFVGTLVRKAWTPVGQGVRPEADVARIGRVCFAGEEGLRAAREIDDGARKIPGLEWFHGMEHAIGRLRSLYGEAPEPSDRRSPFRDPPSAIRAVR